MSGEQIEFPGGLQEEQQAVPEEAAPPGQLRKALLLGVDTGRYDAQRSLEELAALAQADGMEPVAEVLQKRACPDAATMLGAGRLAEARLLADNLDAEVALFDGELTGSQMRRIEEALKVAVMDRTMLILEIFARRATTHEGKLQTELATLEYRLPRLSGMGQVLSRQGGGGGGGGGARRGGGETMLEVDRRYIRRRISMLKKKIAEVVARRDENRRKRNKSGVPLVALVGYTNVGKSSLLNTLTGSDAGVADMLFATLDPTARSLSLPNGQQVVLIDTVGFVSRLPHNLIEAFKSTLDEARYADLLLLVCDISDPDLHEQLETTDAVLKELGVTAPRITVYNKSDRVPGCHPLDPAGLLVSARTGAGLDALQEEIGRALSHRMRKLTLLLPYAQLHLADILRRQGKIETEDYREDGVYIKASLPEARAHLFEAYLYAQEAGPE